MKTRIQNLAKKRYSTKLTEHGSIGYARFLRKRCETRKGSAMVMYFAIFFTALVVALAAPKAIAGIMFMIACIASLVAYITISYYKYVGKYLDSVIAKYPTPRVRK